MATKGPLSTVAINKINLTLVRTHAPILKMFPTTAFVNNGVQSQKKKSPLPPYSNAVCLSLEAITGLYLLNVYGVLKREYGL